MATGLTSRQVRAIEWLLVQDDSKPISAIAEELRLSPRMVRSDLDAIERFLGRYQVALTRKRGVGVWLEGPAEGLDAIRAALAALGDADSIRVISQADRLYLALFALLSAAPEPLTVDQMSRRLGVSVTSARRDVARADIWLAARGLFLARRPGFGMTVIGTEVAIRRSLVKLLLDTVPAASIAAHTKPDWWRAAEISAGLREFLRDLPLAECHKIVAANDSLRRQAEAGNPWLAAYVAVTVLRIRDGRPIDLEAGTLRSLRDHPVWATAESIAPDLSKLAGTALSDDEIGGITKHLLGLAELSVERAGSRPDDPLLDSAVKFAADALHPGLQEDGELIRSLADHVERLRVRLKYGLPVHNPLLREVADRYPEAHAVATDIAQMISEHIGVPVSVDEAGFITMYLSGAMERLRLRPRVRAIVVCPAGIATAWILVSRIQAEFPEIDLVEVLSAGSIDEERIIDADVIISTVEIGPEIQGVDVVVVGALLPDEDVRRLVRLL